MKRRTFIVSVPLLGLAYAAGCSDPRSHAHAVYLLVDTSGTYAQEIGKAQLIVNYLLGSLQPGDSLAVARVRSRSFSEKDIIAKATFDNRPSQANAQRKSRGLHRFRARQREYRHHRGPDPGVRVPE